MRRQQLSLSYYIGHMGRQDLDTATSSAPTHYLHSSHPSNQHQFDHKLQNTTTPTTTTTLQDPPPPLTTTRLPPPLLFLEIDRSHFMHIGPSMIHPDSNVGSTLGLMKGLSILRSINVSPVNRRRTAGETLQMFEQEYKILLRRQARRAKVQDKQANPKGGLVSPAAHRVNQPGEDQSEEEYIQMREQHKQLMQCQYFF